jgi:hypothetical protein
MCVWTMDKRVGPPCGLVASSQGWHVVERNGTTMSMDGRNIPCMQRFDFPMKKISFMLYFMFNFHYVIVVFEGCVLLLEWLHSFFYKFCLLHE